MNEEIADNFPVKDTNGNVTGRMEVKLSCKDYNSYSKGVYQGNDGSSITLSKFIEKDIISKVSEALAEIPYEDMDLMFDFFNQGSDPNKITKKDFKEFILLNMKIRNIRETDLELFLKSSFFLQSKDYIDRNDFRNMFESNIREARHNKLEHTAEFKKKYSDAQTFFKSGDKNSMQINTLGHVTNPFLNQSINQRADVTPSFQDTNKKMNFQETPDLKVLETMKQ